MASAKDKKPVSPITLRLTGQERAELKKLAAGMSVSAYIRKCVFGRNAKPRKPRGHAVVKDRQALAQALGLLGKSELSETMGQMAYEASCGSLLLDEQTKTDIKNACAHIAAIRINLIEALGIKDDAAV